MTLTAGRMTNLTFKSYWGRPRPIVVTEFNGPWQFKPWWDPRGRCPRNCSFFSGEGATAFWTYAPASLAAGMAAAGLHRRDDLRGPDRRLRVVFGGHFFTDVIVAGL